MIGAFLSLAFEKEWQPTPTHSRQYVIQFQQMDCIIEERVRSTQFFFQNLESLYTIFIKIKRNRLS